MKKIVSFSVNILLLTLSIFIILFLAEALLSMYKLHMLPFTSKGNRQWERLEDMQNKWEMDPEMGLIPVMGKNRDYNEYGTKSNSYNLTKNPGVERILFIGDSVAEDGYIVDNLKKIYGTDRYEYWNAGVRGFNTRQEYLLYKRFNSRIKPDHVILLFHMNDFTITPVIFIDKNKKLVLYAPYIKNKKINTFLYVHSYLYRLFFRLSIRSAGWDSMVAIDNMENDVYRLATTIKKDNARFTVIVLPIISPYEKWNCYDKHARKSIIETLQKLDIEYIDVYGALDEAIKKGIEIGKLRNYPEDSWHPSYLMSSFIADYLYEKDLLGHTQHDVPKLIDKSSS